MGELASLALTAANTSNIFSGQQREASAVEARAKYEAGQYDFNASLDARRAADATERGGLLANRMRGQTRQIVGSSRAAIAAGGTDVGSGSARDVQENTAKIGELDALTIENNAAREAWGYKVEESSYANQANLIRMAGKNTAAGLRAQSIGTLLTGAVQTYGLWAEQHPKQPGRYDLGKPTGGRP